MWEETPIQQLWGLVKLKLSYKVLEPRFKCNQGIESVSFSASTCIPVHTCNDHSMVHVL